jgi:hypothetical protein
MKKILAVFAAVLLLAGCGGGRTAAFVPQRYFTAPFTLAHGDYIIKGQIVCNSYEDIRLTFTYPEGLTYLTLQVSSDGFAADIAGITDEIPAGMLPGGAPVRLLTDAVRDTVFTQHTFTADGGYYVTVADVCGSTALCRFGADGSLYSITCDTMNAEITFSE